MALVSDLPEMPPSASKIRVSQVMHYLQSAGWKRRETSRKNALLFEGPTDDDGDPILWYFPDSERYVDYGRSIQLLVNALRIIEERSVDDMVNDLLAQPTDSGDLASAS